MVYEIVHQVDDHRGKLILTTGPMNCNKTRGLIGALSSLEFSNEHVIALTNDINTREVGLAAAEGRLQHPAHTLRIGHVLEDLSRVIEECEQERGEPVTVAGITERQFIPPEEAIPMLYFLLEKNIMTIADELCPDFRGLPFPGYEKVLSMAAKGFRGKAFCQMVRDGKKCGAPAPYNARVLLR